jgi:hypothetical protein
MKLIVKLPEGKPPFIGVRFNNSWNAAKTNEDLIEDHHKDIYQVKFVIKKHTLTLQLNCKERSIHRYYKDLEFEPEKLKRWMQITEGLSGFNFGHTFINGTKEEVGRFSHDLKRLYVLKVDKWEIVEAG